MLHMNGLELCKIFAIDINVKVCFMSSGEINREEVPTVGLVSLFIRFNRYEYQQSEYYT